jgi:hypothetical protein
MIGKDVDVAYFKVLSKLLPEGTKDNHRKPQIRTASHHAEI